MSARIRLACSAAALVFAFALLAGPAGARSSQARKIDRSMRQLFRSQGLNSMVYGAWVDGHPLVNRALGNESPGRRANTRMHFRIGNVTQSFTDTLLLRLVDQHRVKLSDHVAKWFPKLPRARQVTLRMLATSTSGYADYVTSPWFELNFAANPFRGYDAMSLIRLGTGLDEVFPPGKSWAFSDTGFKLLGAILQKITHKPLRVALRQQILEPLRLRQTLMPTNANIPAPVMHAYSTERGKYEESTFWNPSWASLMGSMISSLSDMGRWAAALGRGRVLSRASHRLQVGPATAGLGPFTKTRYYAYGFVAADGWYITNPQLVGYDGTVSYFPAKKLAVVVFTTIGPRGDLAVQHSTEALKRIAQILTPRHVPGLRAKPRG